MSATTQHEDWLPLLQRLLACLRCSRETPLQFEIDSAGIAASALAEVPAGDALHAEPALNALIDEFLSDDAKAPARSGHPQSRSLAEWLDRLYQVMRSVHPSAVDIIALRVAGFDARDIAERLGLGLRQVRSMTREMRASWAGGMEGG